jgi:hypothetical protein
VKDMCFCEKGCKSKVFESESDLQFEPRVNFVSSTGFGYFVVMSRIEVSVGHNVIMTEVRHVVTNSFRWPNGSYLLMICQALE